MTKCNTTNSFHYIEMITQIALTICYDRCKRFNTDVFVHYLSQTAFVLWAQFLSEFLDLNIGFLNLLRHHIIAQKECS